MTISQLYKKHIKGEVSKEKFLYEARRDRNLPWILNTTSYSDAVKILKNKSIISEWQDPDSIPDDYDGTWDDNTSHLPTDDQISGGLGDNISSSDVDPNELEMGIEIEMEHTNNPDIAREIALDHLSEDPQYYSKLRNSGVEDEKYLPFEESLDIAFESNSAIDEIDINDPIMMKMRANKDTAATKKSTSNTPKKDPKKAIKKLIQLRAQTLRDMENDPEVEPEGGPVADSYGKSLEMFDNLISKLRKKYANDFSAYKDAIHVTPENTPRSQKDDPPGFGITEDHDPQLFDLILRYVDDPDEAEKYEDSNPDSWPDSLIANLQNDEDYQKLMASRKSNKKKGNFSFVDKKEVENSISGLDGYLSKMKEGDITVSDRLKPHEIDAIQNTIPDAQIDSDADEDHYYTTVSSSSKSNQEIRAIVDKIMRQSLNESKKTNSGYTYIQDFLVRSGLDYVDPYQYQRAIQFELNKSGDYSLQSLGNCSERVVKNLLKDPHFYKGLLIANYKEVKAADKDLEMKVVKKTKSKDKKKTTSDGYLKKPIKPIEKSNASSTKKENKRGIPDGVTIMKEDILKELRNLSSKIVKEDYHHKYGKGQKVNTPDGFGIITGIVGGTVSVDLESGEKGDYQFNVLDKQARDDHFNKMPNLSAQQDKIKNFAKESSLAEEKSFKKSRGFTEVSYTNKILKISHNGNMGNSIKSVNDNLVHMGIPSIEALKRKFPNFRETGSPDYSYNIVFDTNNINNEAKKYKAAGETIFKSDKESQEFENDLKKAKVPFTKSNV